MSLCRQYPKVGSSFSWKETWKKKERNQDQRKHSIIPLFHPDLDLFDESFCCINPGRFFCFRQLPKDVQDVLGNVGRRHDNKERKDKRRERKVRDRQFKVLAFPQIPTLMQCYCFDFVFSVSRRKIQGGTNIWSGRENRQEHNRELAILGTLEWVDMKFSILPGLYGFITWLLLDLSHLVYKDIQVPSFEGLHNICRPLP